MIVSVRFLWAINHRNSRHTKSRQTQPIKGNVIELNGIKYNQEWSSVLKRCHMPRLTGWLVRRCLTSCHNSSLEFMLSFLAARCPLPICLCFLFADQLCSWLFITLHMVPACLPLPVTYKFTRFRYSQNHPRRLCPNSRPQEESCWPRPADSLPAMFQLAVASEEWRHIFGEKKWGKGSYSKMCIIITYNAPSTGVQELVTLKDLNQMAIEAYLSLVLW